MTKLNKQFVSAVVSISIFLTSLPAYGNDAKKYTALTHELARKVAEDLYRGYLLQSLEAGFAHASAVKNLLDGLKRLEEQVVENRASIGILAESTVEAMFKAETTLIFNEDFSATLKDLNSRLKKLDSELDRLERGRMTAMEISGRMRGAIKETVAKINSACTKGVAGEFSVQYITPITFRPPDFTIGFNLAFSGAGVTADGNFNADYSSLFGRDSADYVEAGTALSMAAVNTLLISLGMEEDGKSSGLAGLIVTAVLIGVALVIDGLERDKASKQAKEIEKALRDRAHSGAVAEYFKETCAKQGAGIKDIDSRIAELERSPRSSAVWTKFNADLLSANLIMEEIKKHLKNLDQAVDRLRKSGVKKENLMSQLKESPEFKAMQEYVKDKVSLSTLSGVFETQVINMFFQSASAQKMFADSQEFKMQTELGDPRSRLDEIDSKILALQNLSYQRSISKQYPQLLEQASAELQSFHAQRALYKEWNLVFSGFLRELFSASGKGDSKAKLSSFLSRTKTFLAEHPDSELGKELQRRAIALGGR